MSYVSTGPLACLFACITHSLTHSQACGEVMANLLCFFSLLWTVVEWALWSSGFVLETPSITLHGQMMAPSSWPNDGPFILLPLIHSLFTFTIGSHMMGLYTFFNNIRGVTQASMHCFHFVIKLSKTISLNVII